MFNFPFMQHALIAGTLIAIMSGLIGPFIVARRMSFLAHTLSEIGFAGASFALFMSWSPLVGMLLFSVVASMSVGGLGIKEQRSESLISAVSAVAIGLGIAFLSLSDKNATAATGILFGSIFSINKGDVLEVAILAILVILVTLLMFRPLRHFAFDYTTASFSLKNLPLIEVLFLGLMAVTVAVSAQVVGSLLIFILMILPASSAMRWGRTVWQIIGLSILFAVVGVWLALGLSFWLDLPVSFFIALIEAVIYFVSLSRKK
ncbi:metal ABC transporter permease [Weissella hellenica]|uniref:Metal ABC transporter permease n=1 Tax=Weissella hellenica TaxID=46256 RepID=A0A4Y4G8S0_WEIHE|nr:metal ABC transporter permease [Weissella hellenica]NKY66319.1 metal ABC transporter permease [Weissella hellenica]GED36580.1 ABC transporter [Weissella hellenica]SCC11419.1 zinc/manganese transport system permease protein [Weissella hellenica]